MNIELRTLLINGLSVAIAVMSLTVVIGSASAQGLRGLTPDASSSINLGNALRGAPTFEHKGKEYSKVSSGQFVNGASYELGVKENGDYVFINGGRTVTVSRLQDGSLYLERMDENGVSWTTSVDRASIENKRKDRARDTSQAAWDPNSVFQTQSPRRKGQSGLQAILGGATVLNDPPPTICYEMMFTDPICQDCSLMDSVSVFGGAILAGAVCAGTAGLGCAAALLAEGVAMDNFMDDCGECNEMYYARPPCPDPPPIPPEDMMIGAWNAWSELDYWSMPPTSADRYSFYDSLYDALNSGFDDPFGSLPPGQGF